MTIYTRGAYEGAPVTDLSELTPTSTEKSAAAREEAILNLPTNVMITYEQAINGKPKTSFIEDIKTLIANKGGLKPKPNFRLNQQQVNEKIQAAGLTEKQFHLEGDRYTPEGVDSLIDRHKRLMIAKEVSDKTDWDIGSIWRGGQSLAIQLADPSNLALAFFPAGKLAGMLKLGWAEKGLETLALRAIENPTVLGRTAAKITTGIIEGAVGATVLEPSYSYTRKGVGDDYTMVNSLENIIGGAAFGGLLHGAIGGIGEVIGKMKTTKVERINELHKELDITQDINRAATIYDEIKERNLDIIDVLNEPEATTILSSTELQLLKYMHENENTPRIISEGLDNYFNAVKNITDKNFEPVDQLLAKAFDIPKTPEEIAVNLDPQTRQDAQQTSVAQMMQGQAPEVETLINADPSIGRATLQDVKEALEKANSIENDYMVKDVQPLPQLNREYTPATENMERASNTEINSTTAKINAEADFELARLSEIGAYSRGNVEPIPLDMQSVHKEQIIKAVRESFGISTDKMLKDSRINIVDNVSQLPGANHPADVQAYSKDGKVYVVAENVIPSQIQGIVLHEVAAHAGIKRILGKDGYNDIIRQVDRLINDGDVQANIARDAVPSDTPREFVKEEILGYLLEYAPEHSLVQKLVSNIKTWFYKTFPSLHDKINLSYADIVTLSKSILKDYADLSTPEHMQSEGAYSRSNIIDKTEIDSFRDELKAYDDTKEKVTNYGNALREIAIGNEAEAIAKIKELTKLSTAESEKMYKQMARKTATYERERLRGDTPEWAVNLDDKERAIQNMMDAQLQDLAVKRRARVFDQRAYINGTTKIFEQFMTPNDAHSINEQQHEGIKSLLVGSILRRDGSGISVASMQQLYSRQLFAELYTNLKKEGLYDLFRTDQGIRDDAMRAQLRRQNGKDYGNLSKESIRIGEIISSVYDKALQMRNEKGTWIRTNNQFVMDNSNLHDQLKMIKVPFEEWRKDALTNYDLQKMADFQDLSAAQVANELRDIYDGIITGQHKRYTDNIEGEQLSAMFGAPNIAKKTAKSRVIYFKDEDAQINYFNKYSGMTYYEAVGHTLEKAAKQAGILEILGPNYEINLNRIMDTVQRQISDPKQKAKFNDTIKYAQHAIEYLDGRANIPANATIARVAANVRSVSRMATTGGSAISSASDFITHAAAIKYSGGDGYLTAVPKAILEMLTPYKGSERLEMLEQMGIISDGIRSQMFDYSGSEDIGKTFQAAERWFYKLNTQNYMSHKMSLVSGDALANNLATWSKKADYAKLPDTMKSALERYGILEPEWTTLRKANLTAADGKQYLVPEGLNNLTNEIKSEIKRESPNISEAEANIIANRKLDKLKNNLQMYYLNTISDDIVGNPNARNVLFLKRGTQKGTIPGEAWNMVMQLKMWPTWMTQNVLGREVYGHGYDTFGQYLKNGFGDSVGLIQVILGMTMAGAVSDTIKSTFRGQKPKDYNTVKAWQAAFSQGGGAGIYGDFLFGTENRAGHSPLGTLLGPIFGNLEDVGKIYNLAKGGDASDKQIQSIPGQLFNTAIKNIPFNNLFYTRWALNYMLLYGIQEHLNPGYLSRMQGRAEEAKQPYYIPPTAAFGQ